MVSGPNGNESGKLLKDGESVPNERLLKYFEYKHLGPALQEVSKHFHDLAHHIDAVITTGPERSVALRKLLEAKDAAVRARLYPGG